MGGAVGYFGGILNNNTATLLCVRTPWGHLSAIWSILRSSHVAKRTTNALELTTNDDVLDRFSRTDVSTYMAGSRPFYLDKQQGSAGVDTRSAGRPIPCGDG